MILYDPQPFGGLEEYAATLAVGLKAQGHAVSVLTTHWTPTENQYFQRLRDHQVEIVQPPKRLSQAASDASTKSRIMAGLMGLATPLIYALAAGLMFGRGRSRQQALTSARGWVHGLLLSHVVGPDRWEALGRLLLNWWHLRWRPDMLHVQGYTTTLLFAVDWGAAHGIPVVYEEHQTPHAQFNWWQGFGASINQASVVVAVSETSAHALRTVCGVTRPIVVRSPLLPDPAASGWHEDVAADRSETSLQVTTVARLTVAKGLHYLCEAIARVQQLHPDVHFRIYGDGDLRDELLAHAAKLGLDGPAIFVGAFTSREELSQIMARTDIFVMSSLLEGQPLGVVEAMAYGRPIVATTVGGIPELIEEGVNGLLCPPADPACLAEKLCRLIEQPGLRVRLGEAARGSYAAGPYQPEAVCEHFSAIYEDARRISRTQGSERVAPLSVADGEVLERALD